MQLRNSIKAFVAKPLGRVALLAFITLALAGSAIYLGYFIAIVVFIVTGLLVPILLGWNRPRTLALVGLAAILVAAPIVDYGTVSLLLTPSPAVNGPTLGGFAYSVLENASVSPYTRGAAGNFTFSVDVNPAFLPNDSRSGILWVTFCLGSNPGAIPTNLTLCSYGSAPPYFFENTTYNSSAAETLSFEEKIGGVNIWWWTMGAAYLNSTGQLNWVVLAPGSGYNAVEGPVTGGFLSIYLLVLPAIYFTVFVYPGLVFFAGLLVYLFLKSRQRRRAGGAPAVAPPASPAGPTATGAAGAATKSPAPGAPSRPEMACPNCGAVVYQGETRCWKCGSPLTGSGGAAPTTDQPLPSGKS